MALIEKLEAIGDAIRAKTGNNELLTLDDMVDEIEGISGGGGDIPFQQLSGNISYMFAYDLTLASRYVDWLSSLNIKTAALTSLQNTFYESIKDWSWLVLNCSDGCTMSGMLGQSFRGTPPSFGHPFIPGPMNMCQNNIYLTNFPENFVQNILINELPESSSNTSGLFHSIRRMRSFPQSWVSSKAIHPQNNFDECYSVDELLNVYPSNLNLISNVMGSIGYRCSHLKRLTFQTDDGQPYIRQWKNQTIRLGDRTGWFNSSSPQYDFLANKNLDKDYENLKNDPNAWANNLAYSRYDHDSAVETINTLPDTSAYLATAGGTNTIQFKTGAGSATDAGAVSDMTAEEIAVATDKGWTVSFV